MQSTSDEVLIGRIANGDRLAMQVLYVRHHVRVFRFVVRLVRDETKAEDLISEVFLDVWRQAGRFEGRSAVSTWMLAIARFKAFSALRRRPDEGLDEATAGAIEVPIPPHAKIRARNGLTTFLVSSVARPRRRSRRTSACGRPRTRAAL